MIRTGEKSIIVEHDIHRLDQSWYDWVMAGILIQHAFNYLNDDEREFLMTAFTEAEWNQLIKEGMGS